VRGNLDFEIDAPAVAFNVLRNGINRFHVVENGHTDVVVRKGELEAASNGFSQRRGPAYGCAFLQAIRIPKFPTKTNAISGVKGPIAAPRTSRRTGTLAFFRTQ